WMRMPFPFPPRATPSPPPLPEGKRAVDGAVLPIDHTPFLGKSQNTGLHGGESPIPVPAAQPAMRGTLRRPLRALGCITPAAASDQDIQQGVHHLAKWHMGHPTPACWGLRGKKVYKELPFQVAQSLESSCHSTLLYSWRALYHRRSPISGIDSRVVLVPFRVGSV